MKTSLMLGCCIILISLTSCKKKESQSDSSGQETPTSEGTIAIDEPDEDLSDSVDPGLKPPLDQLPEDEPMLALPHQLAIVPPINQESGFSLIASSDYDKAVTQTWTDNTSLSALDGASALVCVLAHINLEENLNKGSKALTVPLDRCIAPSTEGVTQKQIGLDFDVTTAADGKSTTVAATGMVDLGVLGGVSGRVIELAFNYTVFEGPTATNPLGIFNLQWSGNLSSVDTVVGSVVVERTEDKLIFKTEYFTPGAKLYSDKTILAELAWSDEAKTLTGTAVLKDDRKRYRSDIPATEHDASEFAEEKFEINFDGKYFLAKVGPEQNDLECRSRTDTQSIVHHYGLYHSASGELVDITAGFSVSYKQGDKTIYGWASDGNLWLDGVEVQSGLQVKRKYWDNSGREETLFTVSYAEGSLTRYDRQEFPVQDLPGTKAFWWDNDEQALYKVQILADGKVLKTAKRDNNGFFDEITPTETVLQNGETAFTSDYLPSELYVIVQDGAYQESFYHQPTNVTLTSESIDFDCFRGCLKQSLTNNDFATDSAYLTDSMNLAAPYSYRYDSTERVLETLTGDKVTFLTGESILDPGHEHYWGFTMGPLVPTGATIPDWWAGHQAPIHYLWATGQHTQNKYTALEDSNGDVFQFDQPLYFQYRHSRDNDRDNRVQSEYYDQRFALSFNGPDAGLGGFPTIRASEIDERYVPAFSLKDGTTLGEQGQYKVKGLFVGQQMAPQAVEKCTHLKP